MSSGKIKKQTFASGASIARGCPRTIGQKPEPTIRRGTARKSLPPGGRGTAIAVEGARETLSLCQFYCNALSLSQPTYSASLRGKFALQTLRLPAPSRREPLCKPVSTKNTTKEISLVVFVFSPLRMQRRISALFFVYQVSSKSSSVK